MLICSDRYKYLARKKWDAPLLALTACWTLLWAWSVFAQTTDKAEAQPAAQVTGAVAQTTVLMNSPEKSAPSSPSANKRKPVVVRLPAWAGRYYPEEPASLLDAVHSRFESSDAPVFTARLTGCIVPPAAVGAGGSVTAAALKSLQPGQYERVIVLCPSHYVEIEDCAIPEADAFLTPLGPVPLDNEALSRLSINPLFVSQPPRPPRRPGPHDIEPGIETVLPFLQERLVEFRLVPVLLGKLADGGGKFSRARADAVARVIRPLITDRTLVIAVSGFTHFGNDFSNRPFNDDIPENIARLDRQAFDLVLTMDADGFDRYVEKTKNAIDGRAAISVLLRLLPPNLEPRLLDYLTTGETMGNWDRSISYAAIVFLDPSSPAPAARPDAVRPLPMKPVPLYPVPSNLPSYLPVPGTSAPHQAQATPPPLAPAEPDQPKGNPAHEYQPPVAE